jgi:hypothetical protein
MEDPFNYIHGFFTDASGFKFKICLFIIFCFIFILYNVFVVLHNHDDFDLQCCDGCTNHYSIGLPCTGMEGCSYSFVCMFFTTVENEYVCSCTDGSVVSEA